ncbi:MAG: amylo-alpha-1,6-glucosidase [Bacillota bacterium]|nr:amylo-alpha-1,6-glucosidase [Bacillota bacterium]
MNKRIEHIMNHEYLMTNGLGGYSFGTLDGANCRKYHSLYTVSMNPPIERVHLISKMVETFDFGDGQFDMTFENKASSTETDSNFVDYVHKGSVQLTYAQGDVTMKKTIAMSHGGDDLALVYDINVDRAGKVNLTPYYNFRDHHDTETPELENYTAELDSESGVLHITDQKYNVYMKASGEYIPCREYSGQSYYPIETDRGYPDVEKHVILGRFSYDLIPGKNRIEISLNLKPEFKPAQDVILSRTQRYDELIEKAGFEDPQINRLVQAADDFVVYRKNTGKKTIIAGYPWFTDWGRDTMIALPGLTLVTGRYDEALEMIDGFISKAYRGIIPNNFPDEGEAPMYNTSDGTLWLFNAIYNYYKHTGDKKAIQRLLPEMTGILKHHISGTINDIYMDTDGLLSTGNEETQLTWMDVKVNGWVVTPRHGKAVEINALWYNALRVTVALASEIGAEAIVDRMGLSEIADQVKKSFNALFWNEAYGNLYDLIIDGQPIDIPRPNMIFAVSLPFAVLDQQKWNPVVDYVTEHFRTPYGLLTLRRDDPDFHPHYGGDLLSRDGAYHRGTAWGWLLGPYFEAHLKTYHDKAFIEEALQSFYQHLDEGIHGSASEIFEGEAPHAQKGCSAQAWSVAEILRIRYLLDLEE